VRVQVVAFSAGVPDSSKLIVVLLDPEIEWIAGDDLRAQLAEWTKKRGASPRLYPGALYGASRNKVATCEVMWCWPWLGSAWRAMWSMARWAVSLITTTA